MKNLLYNIFFLVATLTMGCQQSNTSNKLNRTNVEYTVASLLPPDTALVLTADTARLEDNLWLLQELNGQTIAISEKQELPSILFRSEDRIYISKTDCNGISGKYQVERDRSLQFLQLFHTEIACENMEIEKGLLAYLPRVRSYQIDGKKLTLFDEHNVAIVRLSQLSRIP